MRHASALPLLAFFLALGSCGDGTGPGPEPTNETFAGTYQLAAVDGAPLPVVWAETDSTALRLTSGLLAAYVSGDYQYGWGGHFASKATGEIVRRLRLPRPDAGGTYTLEGRTVRFVSDSGRGEGPADTGEATHSGTVRSPDEVQMRMTVEGQVRTMTFRRVCGPEVNPAECTGQL